MSITHERREHEDRRAGEGVVEAVHERCGLLRPRPPRCGSAAIVERIASPSAPPICCEVLKRPEASPWSSFSRPVVATA